MFKTNTFEKSFFFNNGYLVKDIFLKNDEFLNCAKNLNKEITEVHKKQVLQNLGGFKSGNLNIEIGDYSNQFIKLFLKYNLENFFNELFNDKLDEYEIKTGGNLNLPGSKNQLFHTDGNWDPRMIIFNLATTDIHSGNGPIEILEGSHKEELPYWNFLLKSRKFQSKKIPMKKGQILIREHRLWHRGTKNLSSLPREMIGILFIKKKNGNKFLKGRYEKVCLYENMYENNLRGRFKEFIFINFKFLLVLYKIIISMMR